MNRLRLTVTDRKVLFNFSKLNKHIKFSADNKIKTISNDKSILAEYHLQGSVDKDFYIYDLKMFLNQISFFYKPIIELHDKKVVIKENDTVSTHHFADPDYITYPKKNITEPDIEDVTYNLDIHNHRQLKKSKEVSKHKDVLFYDDENEHMITLCNVDELKTPGTWIHHIPTEQKTNKSYFFKTRAERFSDLTIKSDYKISFWNARLCKLENQHIPLKYYIALEPSKSPDTKRKLTNA